MINQAGSGKSGQLVGAAEDGAEISIEIPQVYDRQGWYRRMLQVAHGMPQSARKALVKLYNSDDGPEGFQAMAQDFHGALVAQDASVIAADQPYSEALKDLVNAIIGFDPVVYALHRAEKSQVAADPDDVDNAGEE
jgi:hypothetical protein